MATVHLTLTRPLVKYRDDVFISAPGSTANDDRMILSGPVTIRGPVDILAGHLVIPEGFTLEVRPTPIPSTGFIPNAWGSGGTGSTGGLVIGGGVAPGWPSGSVLASGVTIGPLTGYYTNTIGYIDTTDAAIVPYAEGASYAT